MEEKVMFVAPEAEVVRFPKQDIVTTSGEVTSVTSVTDENGNITTPIDPWD